MYLHLFLAVFWLVLGAALLIAPKIHPDMPEFRVWGTGLPIGWVAVFLSIYNLLRWSVWYFPNRRRQESARRPPIRRPRRSPGLAEPDPDFNFTEPSPKDENAGPAPGIPGS
jgi:hypothetical protein